MPWGPQSLDVILKLLIAFGCGLALGAEREMRDKSAGIRTIVLIAVGSALYQMVGEAAAGVVQGSTDLIGSGAAPDPTRIGSGVVSGIGFLGAGSIIQSRGAVHGLTTAATIWVAAAVGLCAGVGMYGVALGTTAAVLLALILLDPLAERFRSHGHRERSSLFFFSPHDMLVRSRIELLLREHGVSQDSMAVEAAKQGLRWQVEVHLRPVDQLRLLEALSEVPGVNGREDGAATRDSSSVFFHPPEGS